MVALWWACAAPEAPELQNLGVDLDPSSFSAGDSFLEFYSELQGPDGPKRNPTFEYRLVDGTEILAPIDAVVEVREANGGEDSSVFLTPEGGRGFLVMLDHVLDLTVATGDEVRAGDVLGTPGEWNGDGGRSELQINDPDGVQQCPTTLLAPAVASDLGSAVTNLMAALEAAAGDDALYDEAAMTQPGCLIDAFRFE